MEWKKIIDETQALGYTKKLSEIVDVLLKETKEMKNDRIDLMGGKAGIALFFFYYARFTGKEEYYDYGMALLNEIFDNINEGFVYHTFAGGLAGIGWTVEHLAKTDFIEADSDEILSDVDPFLRDMMISEIKNSSYDFLHGALGIGIYFLGRTGNKKSVEYLAELVDGLDNMAVKETDGAIKWESILMQEENLKGFNLSLSHGISSIIVFLAKMVERGINKDKAAALLKGAIQYLLQQALEPGKYLSLFPSWIAAGHEPTHSRLAWCYGDLGNGLAFWQAAAGADEKMWREKAVDIMLHTAKRRDIKENMVIDPGLCHGAAGIAHIFNRMYQQTGGEIFKETALYWYEQALKLAFNKDGFAGYKVWRTEKYGGWTRELGFLEGISGIGLAFISLLSDSEPRWDRALLMS